MFTSQNGMTTRASSLALWNKNEFVTLLSCMADLSSVMHRSPGQASLLREILQRCSVCLRLASWQDRQQRSDPKCKHTWQHCVNEHHIKIVDETVKATAHIYYADLLITPNSNLVPITFRMLALSDCSIEICLQTCQHTAATQRYSLPSTAHFEKVSKFQTDPIDTN